MQYSDQSTHVYAFAAHSSIARPAILFTLFVNLLISTSITVAHADKQIQSPELNTHRQLISHALTLDAYNQRCRGISVDQFFNQVNRLYVTKYSLTANNFIKHYASAGATSTVTSIKYQHQKNLTQYLATIGGCQSAKKNGWLAHVKTDFKTLYKQAEQSNWLPD